MWACIVALFFTIACAASEGPPAPVRALQTGSHACNSGGRCRAGFMCQPAASACCNPQSSCCSSDGTSDTPATGNGCGSTSSGGTTSDASPFPVSAILFPLLFAASISIGCIVACWARARRRRRVAEFTRQQAALRAEMSADNDMGDGGVVFHTHPQSMLLHLQSQYPQPRSAFVSPPPLEEEPSLVGRPMHPVTVHLSGALGLNLTPRFGGRGLHLNAFSDVAGTKIGEGEIQSSGVIREGMDLVIVNGADIAQLPYDAALGVLMRGAATRPLSLVFLGAAPTGHSVALVHARIPCFEPHLARAYGEGVRALAHGAAPVAVEEELRCEELVALLSLGGEGRALALHTLKALLTIEGDAALPTITNVIAAGVVPIIMRCAAEASATLETQSSDIMSPALSEVALCANVLRTISFHPQLALNELCISSAQHFHTLAAAVASMMRDAVHESNVGTAVTALEVEVATQLAQVLRKLRSRSQNLETLYLPTRSGVEFCERGFLSACCAIISRFPQSPLCSQAISIVLNGANDECVCEMLQAIGGFESILNAISSTMHAPSAMSSLLCIVSNAATASSKFAVFLAQQGAFRAIQPALFSDDGEVSLSATLCIAMLSIVPENAEIVSTSDALDVCATILHATIPGTVRISLTLEFEDLRALCGMLSPDNSKTVRLIALHQLSGLAHDSDNKKLCLGNSAALLAVRDCVTSSDAFLYYASISVLKQLDLPIPSYRAQSTLDALGQESTVETWGIDAVCMWVGDQTFASYRHVFRTSLVTGRVLLSLTVEDLGAMGITHTIHQRSIVFAIDELRSSTVVATAPAGTGGAAAMPVDALALHHPLPSRRIATYDVFLSYRRAGGADFAQLLKVELQAAGLKVFLDIENLGTGKFDEALKVSMGNSKNIVLVWTKGCMDRFLAQTNPLDVDFVKEEYLLALRMGKNIIPVYKEDFVFPREEDMPTCVAPVLRINAIKWVSEYREASLQKLRGRIEE